VGEWENVGTVCENEEFVHGKFVVMCSRMGTLYVQLCENWPCAHTEALRTGTPCSFLF
jgi:hypothetical protein